MCDNAQFLIWKNVLKYVEWEEYSIYLSFLSTFKYQDIWKVKNIIFFRDRSIFQLEYFLPRREDYSRTIKNS